MTTKTSTSNTADSQTPISPGTAFTLLRDEDRRFLLAHLTRTVGVITLEAAADAIAAQIGDRSPTRREQLLTALHHVHVPMLVDAGVLAYDSSSHILELCPRAASLDPYLEGTRYGSDAPMR